MSKFEENLEIVPLGSSKSLNETGKQELQSEVRELYTSSNSVQSFETMTEEEIRDAEKMKNNLVTWGKDFLGIDIVLPSNATSVIVEPHTDDVENLQGKGDLVASRVVYNRNAGKQTFARVFNHELNHRIKKYIVVALRREDGSIDKGVVGSGLSTSKAFLVEKYGFFVDENSLRGWQLEEAVTELMNISQQNYFRVTNGEDNLNSVSCPYDYDILFWDTIFEACAERVGKDYKTLQKELFKTSIEGKSRIRQELLSAFPGNRETIVELLKTVPFDQEVIGGFWEGLLKQNGVYPNTTISEEEYSTEVSSSEASELMQGEDDFDSEDAPVLTSYKKRILKDIDALKKLGIDSNFIQKLDDLVTKGEIHVLGDITFIDHNSQRTYLHKTKNRVTLI